jgi:hypothetical protein
MLTQRNNICNISKHNLQIYRYTSRGYNFYILENISYFSYAEYFKKVLHILRAGNIQQIS